MLSGWDRRNRIRQRALDRALMDSGRLDEILVDMLDELAWRPDASAPEPASAPRSDEDARSCEREYPPPRVAA